MRIIERLLSEIPNQIESEVVATKSTGSDSTNAADIAEAAVLAGCCRNPDYALNAVTRLVASDFDLEWRQRVWLSIEQLVGQGEPVDSASLYPLLGPVLWNRLAGENASARNPHEQDYCRMVRGYARMRAATAAMLAEIAEREELP
uniref:Putative helicase n=1 Tax=viral metagenome TaxID=1070528 RepID=A0A6M3LII2_9ZZZZ